MTVNEKILQFVEYLNISQRKFTNNSGLAEGALRGSKSIGTENLIKIKLFYPILNIDWVLFNEGNMLLKHNATQMTANESGEHYENGCVNCDHLEELLEAKNETIAILKHQLGINNDGDKSKAS